jgi:hypothetical protein
MKVEHQLAQQGNKFYKQKRIPAEVPLFYNPCFPTLESYAQYMGHPNASSAFDGQDWRHHVGKKGRESNCSKLAQATMNHAAKEPMGHLYYDLRLSPSKNGATRYTQWDVAQQLERHTRRIFKNA